MKKIHLFSGILFLIAFSLTGQYMLHILDLPNQDMNSQRMLYRASHMYIFFAAATNIAIGCYWVQRQGRFRKILQNSGSAMLILSQPILLAAFVTEPQTIGPSRDITLLSCVLILAGVALSLACSLLEQEGT